MQAAVGDEVIVVAGPGLIVTVLMAWLTATVAGRKGMSFQGWLLWSFVGWPLTLPLALLETGEPDDGRPGWVWGVVSVSVGLVTALAVVVGWELAH